MDFFEKPLLKISSGPLQECLNGEFVRVGPNPKFVPVAGYHWYGLLLRENHSSIFIALEAFSVPFICTFFFCNANPFLIGILLPFLYCRFDGDGYVMQSFPFGML
jgi:hypothetical protein